MAKPDYTTQTASEYKGNIDSELADSAIKTSYENNADTNAFSDAEQTKLAGIEAGAEVNASFRGCLVKPTVTFSVPNSTATWIPFADEEYDTDGIHDTVTNNDRLTVPAGVTKVKITGHIQFSSTSTTGKRTLQIIKNASTVPTGVSTDNKLATSAGTTPCNVFSATLEVTAGDYFRLSASQDSGGSLTTFTTSWFAMEIIE